MSSNSIAGLISGLDTTALIDAMITSRSRPLFLLQQRQAQKTAELSAWKSFEAVLIGLKVETDRLGNSSLWDDLKITSSDEDVLTAAADSSAALGSYSFFVEALAQAEQRQSQAFSSRDGLVGSGTFSITAGSDTTDIEVSAGTSLEGLADLINESDADVTASIIRSEASGVESYYLVVTANETGAASSFTVDSTGLAGGTAPDLTAAAVRLGQDAKIRFGGESGLEIFSSTNVFENVVDGLDLTVRKVQELGGGESPITVGIARDTESIEDAVSAFVDRYNTAMSFVNSQFRFDPELEGVTRPPLMGNATLTNIGSDIRSLITRPVTGLADDAAFRTLFSLGMKSSATGELSFSASELQDAMENDFEAVASLFRAQASYSSTGVEWLSAPPEIEIAGTSVDVVVTQAATRAMLTGNTIDLSSGITIDATNDAFLVNIDGVTSEELTVAHGTYTDGDALAKAIADAIASSDDLGSLGAAVSFEDEGGGQGKLVFTSDRYGAAATLRLQNTASSFASALGLSSVMNVDSAGTDVEGTINGFAAEGSGRILTASEDDETYAGATFKITLTDTDTPATITTSFSEGIGRVVSRRLERLTQAGDGTLTRMGDSIQRRIDLLARDIVLKQEQLDARRARLVRQYAGLESTLGRLQNQGAFLSAQLQSTNSGFGLNTGR